jgi:hypothetical protein
MIELAEFALTFWKQSKKDWQKNKHRIFAFFGFILMAFFILEFGSFVFTKKLNEAKSIDLIRSKFMDKRVMIADQASTKILGLKEQARRLIKDVATRKNDSAYCTKLVRQYNLEEVESDMIVSFANIRYFFGDNIANELIAFFSWFDDNVDNCFANIPDAEHQMDEKVMLIKTKLWKKMYPQEIIKGIR